MRSSLIFLKTFSLLFLFCLPNLVFSKNIENKSNPLKIKNYITVSGQIISSDDQKAIPFVHVINKTKKIGVVSDKDGFFSIKATVNDSISFSYIGYETYNFVLEEPIQSEHYVIKVTMGEATQEMQAVTIYAFPSLDEFKKELLSTKVEKKENIKFKGVHYGERRNGVETPLKKAVKAIKSPVSSIANLFNDKAKQNKKLGKLERSYGASIQARGKFTKAMVTDITGYAVDSTIVKFMNFCNFSDNFLVNSSQYDILVAITEKQKVFKKLYSMDK